MLFRIYRRRIDKCAFADHPQKILGGHNRQPFVVVAAVKHHRQLVACIALRLAHPIVRVALLAALHLEMQATQSLAHHIGRFRATCKLLAPTSRESLVS